MLLLRTLLRGRTLIEPDLPGDPFEISDADTMLRYLAPNASKPLDVTVFSRDGCPYCVAAKQALRNAGIAFEELVLNRDYTEQTLRAVADAATVPQVFVNGARIGGSAAVEAWLSERKAA